MKTFHLMGPAPYYTNSFVLCSEAGNALAVDPVAAPAYYQKALDQAGAKLRYILLTHGHFDHTGTLEELKKTTGAQVVAAGEDLKGSRLFPVASADLLLKDEMLLELDELKIRCWHTPGHTPGSYCFLCGDLFITGDTLFAGSIGRTDLEGGSYPEMEKSLARLLSLPVPDQAQVLPGHGEFSTFGREKKTNGFLQF